MIYYQKPSIMNNYSVTELQSFYNEMMNTKHLLKEMGADEELLEGVSDKVLELKKLIESKELQERMEDISKEMRCKADSERYHTRRISEIKERINVLENYVDSKTKPTHKENGVGRSYLNRRNSKIKANQEMRVSEFKGELQTLYIDLDKHIAELDLINI